MTGDYARPVSRNAGSYPFVSDPAPKVLSMLADTLVRPRRAADLARILQGGLLHPRYQPIADLFHGSIHGYESLIRGPLDHPLHMPDALFAEAREQGRQWALELACLRAGLRDFPAGERPSKLFLNLSASVLLACWREWGEAMPEQLLAGSGIAPRDVVIELTEHDPVGDDLHTLLEALGCLRANGSRIALDDYGTGNASLHLWAELRPDLVKIDRYFFRGIGGDAARQQLVRALLSVAQALGTPVLAEGVETPEDLAAVRDLGIRYAQGWLLGRPAAAAELQTGLPEPVRALLNLRRGAQPQTVSPYDTVWGLRVEAPAVRGAEHTNDDVHKFFLERPDLHAVAVVDEHGYPVGLINRRAFSEQYAIRYTRELFGQKPCTAFMQSEPLLVDADTAVSRLGPVLISEDQRYLRDGFILTREGRYAGLGTGEALVRAVTEIRMEAARYANPLTALPGNIPISRQIGQLLEGEDDFIVCYGDLDNFKPFNDVYGYWRGDDMIQLCAEVIKQHCDVQRDFVGHVGGDDFVMLLRSPDWRRRLQALIAEFNERARALYDEEGRRNGGIEAEDRYGVPRFFPFVTLGVGALIVRPGLCGKIRPQDIASASARVKHRVKHEQAGLIVEDYAPPGA